MKKNNVWILGPCSMYPLETYLETAKKLSAIMGDREWYYKGSFDKANRSKISGERGPGLNEARTYFERVKKENPGIKLITDVHETYQVKELVGLVDCIQVPAFLCRQTDILSECAKHFDTIFVKKGQWMTPKNTVHIAEKIKAVNPTAKVWLGERGTTFNGEMIVNFRHVPLYNEYFDRVIFDVTHSTQYENSGGCNAGDSKLAQKYLLIAPTMEYGGIFAETHPRPKESITDGDCMIPLDEFEKVFFEFDQLHQRK